MAGHTLNAERKYVQPKIFYLEKSSLWIKEEIKKNSQGSMVYHHQPSITRNVIKNSWSVKNRSNLEKKIMIGKYFTGESI